MRDGFRSTASGAPGHLCCILTASSGVIKTRGNVGSEPCASMKVVKNGQLWMKFGQPRFLDGLNVECEIKGGSKDGSEPFVLSSWKDEATVNRQPRGKSVRFSLMRTKEL